MQRDKIPAKKKHGEIEHNIVSCLNVIDRGEMGM